MAIEDGQAGFTIDLSQSSNGVVLAMGGELDVSAAPYLQERLMGAVKEDPANLRIDLSGVTFLDSMAVGLLVSTKRQVGAYEGSFAVSCCHPSVRRVLEIMGLIEYLNVDAAG
jgi:anti-sigma B factor antagonist